MADLRVTEQQFKKGMENQAFYKTELLYEAIGEAGFVLVDKQALQKRLEYAINREKGWLGERKHEVDKVLAAAWRGAILLLNELLM